MLSSRRRSAAMNPLSSSEEDDSLLPGSTKQTRGGEIILNVETLKKQAEDAANEQGSGKESETGQSEATNPQIVLEVKDEEDVKEEEVKEEVNEGGRGGGGDRGEEEEEEEEEAQDIVPVLSLFGKCRGFLSRVFRGKVGPRESENEDVVEASKKLSETEWKILSTYEKRKAFFVKENYHIEKKSDEIIFNVVSTAILIVSIYSAGLGTVSLARNYLVNDYHWVSALAVGCVIFLVLCGFVFVTLKMCRLYESVKDLNVRYKCFLKSANAFIAKVEGATINTSVSAERVSRELQFTSEDAYVTPSPTTRGLLYGAEIRYLPATYRLNTLTDIPNMARFMKYIVYVIVLFGIVALLGFGVFLYVLYRIWNEPTSHGLMLSA